MKDKILGKLIFFQGSLAQIIGGNPPKTPTIPPQTTPDQVLEGLKVNKTLDAILKDLTGFAVGLALAIAVLMIIWAGYQMLTAGGDPAQFEKGKKTIAYAVGGIIVILLAAAIIEIIKNLLGAK